MDPEIKLAHRPWFLDYTRNGDKRFDTELHALIFVAVGAESEAPLFGISRGATGQRKSQTLFSNCHNQFEI